MRRLTGLDASFLYLETPNNHMHVGAVYVLDPEGDASAASAEVFRRIIAERIHLLPPFRWKLVEVPFGLHHPIWINDGDLDLEYHVRPAALPAPGGMKELADLAARFMARPLDRSRPLWEMEIVEGLEGGRCALLSKTHHAAIDGASGAELTANLLDLTKQPRRVEPPAAEFRAERRPSDLEMLAFGLRSAAAQPSELLHMIGRAPSLVRTLQQRSAEGTSGKLPFQSPRTSLNGPITPHRTLSTAMFPLSEIKEIRAAFGGTVNDVVLSVCGGALRTYLAEERELPDDPLVAMVPVSVRATDQNAAMGNRVAQMLVPLGTDVAAPAERLRAVQEQTAHAKGTLDAIGADTLANWTEFAAPAIAARAAQLYSSMQLANRVKPLFNLTVSNLPGPQFPLYAAGARLVEWFPMGPVYDGAGLNITVISYDGVVYAGLLACKETVPRIWDLATFLTDAKDELLTAARAARPPARPATARRVRAESPGSQRARTAPSSPRQAKAVATTTRADRR
jgi:WS/DGAT/MGAT family acyltransferase